MKSNLLRLGGNPSGYAGSMDASEIDPIRKGVGQRIAAARELKGYSQTEVGNRFGVGKGTVSAWETGRGDPGIYRLRELAKLYDVSSDGLLWDGAPSIEAMQIAAQYDGLTEKQKSTWRALWLAYITDAGENGNSLPLPPKQSAHLKD